LKRGGSPASRGQYTIGTREEEKYLVVGEPVSTGYDFDPRVWLNLALVRHDFLERVGVFSFLNRRTEEGVNLPQI
jgi:hypothetical protein